MNKAYLFGIEVEVENVTHLMKDVASLNYWKFTTDNSLRDNGCEFCSLPIRANQVEGAIQELEEFLPKEKQFSNRTSCHVHMNVRDLTISEIYNLIIIYYALEKILFRWVGHNRQDNVFCVPLTDGRFYRNLTSFQVNIHQCLQHWNKYTALNLIPIQNYGTVEFRHMYGTLDTTVLLTWINLLCCLKDTAKRYETQELEQIISNLNTNSEYALFLERVFNVYHTIFAEYPLQTLMEKPVSQLKLAFPNKDVNVKEKPEFEVTFDDGIEEIAATPVNIAANRQPPRPPGIFDTLRTQQMTAQEAMRLQTENMRRTAEIRQTTRTMGQWATQVREVNTPIDFNTLINTTTRI